MSVRNHYDTLGLSKTATQEEIKAVFRRLSMATHPDVAKGADGEAFKAIAEANSILSNATERLKYDRQLQEASMWRPGRRAPGSGGDFYGGDNLRRPGAGKSPMHVAMETLSNPRYVILGAVAFGSVCMMSAMLGGVSSKQPEYHHHSQMVEAWKNPNTGRWEQPAPWDPIYRQLKPKLELIPRERVQRRHM